jgi:hypothetical protein
MKMTEKTYSQKIARVFEIADYILLVPAVGGALLATLIPSLLTVLVYAFLLVGCALLVGYFRHSRGMLEEGYVSALWITSAVYNLILLLPCLYYVSTMLQAETFGIEGDETGRSMIITFLIPMAIVFGYLAAVISSMKAYFFERRRKII